MTGGGVPGELHFDVGEQRIPKLRDGIAAIFKKAHEDPLSPGGQVLKYTPDTGWDLSWRRDWTRDTIEIRWHNVGTVISGELIKDVMSHDRQVLGVIVDMVAKDLERPPSP